MSACLLTVDGLSVQFAGAPLGAPPVVDDVSLQVSPREVLALIGESGSGKSTILNAIAGLLPASAQRNGRMLLEGHERDFLAREADRRNIAGREIAMIFQNPSSSLNPVLTIGTQLNEVVAAHRKLSWKQAGAVSRELVRDVGLPSTGPQAKDWLGAYPHQLSGGQKQRIAIAAALAGEPRLLLADEPTTALDATVQAQILDLLLQLVDERGIAIIFVTHDLAVAASIADRMAVLRDGKLVEQGVARTLVTSPRSAYTKTLLAASLPFLHNASPRPPAQTVRDDAEALVLQDIFRSFAIRGGGRVQAVDGVSLQVAPGEIVGLIGESGSGKTTLGRIAVGLERADAGRIALGTERLDPVRHRRVVQMVFQDPLASFNPRQSIGQALRHPLRCLRGISGGRADEMIAGLLNDVGLDPAFVSRLPQELSGGQLQRVAIARALAAQPSFLVCDEAVASLDVSIRAQVLDLLAGLRAATGLGILFISHDLGVIQQIADRTLVMHNGVVVENGPTADLLSAPCEAYTRQLIASVPNGQTPWRQARATMKQRD